MCGICGIQGKFDHNTVKSMMALLHHRGPDASGLHQGTDGVFGHVRLSIMDPEWGNQPIFNEDKSLAVMANGEIYNYHKLAQELKPRHKFKTGSDTEILLHLYEEYGINMVHKIDGMFSFCIVDGDSLFLARDYIGIKPLYYLKDTNGNLSFSSEMKALKGRGREIREFPPGTWYHSKMGFQCFYKVPDLYPEDKDWPEYAHQLRVTVEESVRKRLMSDVPVGAFLSGGLDSSIIAAIARKHIPKLHTFSVGFEGSSDIAAARLVAKHIDSQHHEYIITSKDVNKYLDEIIYHLESFDQDLVRSAIPCYFVSRLAADYVKVILTGEGADELFGGYTYYREILDEKTLHQELRRSVQSMHNINLQRVDRLTMAHSVEGRVPFLDKKMIELGFMIPTKWKLRGDPPIEKWILRKAFEDILPSQITWRKKLQFDEGSGTVDALTNILNIPKSHTDSFSNNANDYNVAIRSDEELHFYQIFTDIFPDTDTMLASVGRWSERF